MEGNSLINSFTKLLSKEPGKQKVW